MTEGAPSIVVVDDDGAERALIAGVLRETGFIVTEAAEARGALTAVGSERFAAAVVVLPVGQARQFLRRARCRQPGLAALVVAPGARRLTDDHRPTPLRRAFELRHLLGRVFDLVLREAQPAGEAPRQAAELGIAAAELACLDNRRVAAAASGASRLARDLTRQIGEAGALCRSLAGALTIGDPAPAGAAARAAKS